MQSAANIESMSSSTPSPTASATASTSSSRRPPRKSTLTQQQKNQKRQRATQDQLATLEVEFNKNPTPTAAVRERIAQDINMTERSVQIWFQNRFVSRRLERKILGLLTREIVDGRRSSCWRRRASKPGRTVMRSRSQCANTLPFRPWSRASLSAAVSLPGPEDRWPPMATTVCPSTRSQVIRAKSVCIVHVAPSGWHMLTDTSHPSLSLPLP